MTSGPITRGRHERWISLEKWWFPTRSDFSRIAVINLILRNARSHLRDECPLTSKSVRLSAAAALAQERFAKFWQDWRLVRAPGGRWIMGYLQGLSAPQRVSPDPRATRPKDTLDVRRCLCSSGHRFKLFV
jgi:hypothetical protein